MGRQVLIIDGWTVPKLIEYTISYNKLWSEDTGRDMTGENKGTLIGLFPKLQVTVGSFDETEMAMFLSKVNKAKINIDWYDAEGPTMRNGISYYINDFEVSLKDSKRMRYKSFSFNLIPNKRR